MKQYVEKTEKVTHRVLDHFTCDQCKEKINTVNEDEVFGFSTNHTDWPESHEWYELCSWACFLKMLPNLIEDLEERTDATINDMPLWLCKQILEVR